MADLSTLKGISEARGDLYNKVLEGSIQEQRANVLDRILRGQTYLCGDLRLKYIKTVASYKGGKLESYTAGAIRDLDDFLVPPKQVGPGAGDSHA
jgi:hypothetical protein